MGRTSKFSFPVPGRSRPTAARGHEKPPLRSPMPNGLSKAQRILGTDSDLNIDSPSRDGDDISWRHLRSDSSDMSISISDSTYSVPSTNETAKYYDGVEELDAESGIFPTSGLLGKASSNILGETYREDNATDTSSVRRRMRHEESTSTLKSYYDRQNSPLAISQQTSASSARDLALRKGCPPVVSLLPRAPLPRVEPSNIHVEQSAEVIAFEVDPSQDKPMGKPARLDLSMLFPSRKKQISKMSNVASLSPFPLYSNLSTVGTQDKPLRRLVKAMSKESLRSPQPTLRTTKSQESVLQRHSKDTLTNLFDSYEQLALSPVMAQIPETRVPDAEPGRWPDGSAELQHHHFVENPTRSSSSSELETKSQEYQNFGTNDSHARINVDTFAQPGKTVAEDIEALNSIDPGPVSRQVQHFTSGPRRVSRAASVSSRNTKASRHTSTSIFSTSDLKLSSVLSLSSDSEEDVSEEGPVPSRACCSNERSSQVLGRESRRPLEARRRLSPPQKIPQRRSSRHFAVQESPFLTIPESTVTSSRISGPWSPPKLDYAPIKMRAKAEKKERRLKKLQSNPAKHTSIQPTPPQSPDSELKEVETESNRFMAVTEQEEALLEALRKKRAHMREAIIEEHEKDSPPRSPDRRTSRQSGASSVGTIRQQEIPNSKHRILLYLDTSINNGGALNKGEPSPDLSDFLSFDSDEDSTPRTSWALLQKGRAKHCDSLLEHRKQTPSPSTQPSARLSAGAYSAGLRHGTAFEGSVGAKKKNTLSEVRFLDDARLGQERDFALKRRKRL